MSHCNEMICQQVTLSGYAEGPKVADAVIEAGKRLGVTGRGVRGGDAEYEVRGRRNTSRRGRYGRGVTSHRKASSNILTIRPD
jgi:hypothetical protein